jgi:hypothetical protein
MTFRDKRFEKCGNHYNLIGTEINIYHWNKGKSANFLVTAGYGTYNHIEKAFPKSETAREDAIKFALSIQEQFKKGAKANDH